jgi:endonuclease YncB( thermonuclease family)
MSGIIGAVRVAVTRLTHNVRLRLMSNDAAARAPRLELAKGRLLARIVHVHDGDTVIALCIQGGCMWRRRCRLIGIDAPELSGPRADRRRAEAARHFLQCLLAQDHMVVLHFDGFDKYGRLLVDFRIGGRWVTDQLVEHSHARRMGPGGRRLPRQTGPVGAAHR